MWLQGKPGISQSHPSKRYDSACRGEKEILVGAFLLWVASIRKYLLQMQREVDFFPSEAPKPVDEDK